MWLWYSSALTLFQKHKHMHDSRETFIDNLLNWQLFDRYIIGDWCSGAGL